MAEEENVGRCRYDPMKTKRDIAELTIPPTIRKAYEGMQQSDINGDKD